MDIDTYLKGKTLGFGNAHPEDAILHANLLSRALAGGQPIYDVTYMHRGALRMGEHALAKETAQWVRKNNIDVLVTPAVHDHVEHDSAAHIGRIVAVLLRDDYELDLLELQAPGKAHPDSLAVPATPESLVLAQTVEILPVTSRQPQFLFGLEARRADPFEVHIGRHRPPAEAAMYRLLPAERVALAQNELTLIMDARQYAILNR